MNEFIFIARLNKNIGGINKKRVVLRKQNDAKITINEIIELGNHLIETAIGKYDKEPQMVIRAMGIDGVVTLKGYTDTMDVIRTEEQYFEGRVRDKTKHLLYDQIEFTYFV